MRYLSGIQALALKCDLNTSGEWNSNYFTWDKLDIRESENSVFKDYGIESAVTLPNGEVLPKKLLKANHLRAILDLLESAGNYSIRLLRCFAIDFLNTDEYNQELFEKVVLLAANRNWAIIDAIMTSEFEEVWLDFKAGQ